MQPARGAVWIREVFAVGSLQRFRGETGRRRGKNGKDNAFISPLSLRHRGCRIDLIIITGSLSIIAIVYFGFSPRTGASRSAAAISGIHLTVHCVILSH